MPEPSAVLLSLNPHEARAATAIFERLFPADELGPGAAEIGVLAYLDRALAGPYRQHAEAYRLGLATLDQVARARHGQPFADCAAAQQDALLSGLEQGALPDFSAPPQQAFFALLRALARGPVRRPGPRRQPRQAGLALFGPHRDLVRE